MSGDKHTSFFEEKYSRDSRQLLSLRVSAGERDTEKY